MTSFPAGYKQVGKVNSVFVFCADVSSGGRLNGAAGIYIVLIFGAGDSGNILFACGVAIGIDGIVKFAIVNLHAFEVDVDNGFIAPRSHNGDVSGHVASSNGFDRPTHECVFGMGRSLEGDIIFNSVGCGVLSVVFRIVVHQIVIDGVCFEREFSFQSDVGGNRGREIIRIITEVPAIKCVTFFCRIVCRFSCKSVCSNLLRIDAGDSCESYCESAASGRIWAGRTATYATSGKAKNKEANQAKNQTNVSDFHK